MKYSLVFVVMFLSLGVNAQGVSTGSNTDSDYKTEDSTSVSRERSLDASKTDRDEVSTSNEISKSKEDTREKGFSTQDTQSQGKDYSIDHGVEPIKIISNMVLNLEYDQRDNPLIKQIRKCSIKSDPCVPTFNINGHMFAIMDPVKKKKNYPLPTDYQLSCNAGTATTEHDAFGPYRNWTVIPHDLITRTVACYALSSYTIEQTILNMQYSDGSLVIDRYENFNEEAHKSLEKVIASDYPKVMGKALAFSQTFVGASCRIVTLSGFASGTYEWSCSGLDVDPKNLNVKFMGMSLIGGDDILGKTYVVRRQFTSGEQYALERSISDRESLTLSTINNQSESTVSTNENSASMRRTSTTEQGSTVTTGVGTKSDTTASGKQ
ncbi:hypothetical protein [Teredinibacter turnerae]|uniref:hypothetical protein n=1 Tax=Teredinibacter turnerae TaxID=2426 RepID=UPI00039B5F1E|nr:hypothetical protein [Teredinibacter turnerae]